jgi:hypothetical protein
VRSKSKKSKKIARWKREDSRGKWLIVNTYIHLVFQTSSLVFRFFAVWKFNKNPIKPRFICAASSASLTEVSKWMSSFYKAIFLMVNDLWVSKLRKADVPCVSWILNNFTGVVDVIK